jgi:alpha-glucosidase
MLPGTSVTYYGEEIGMENSCVIYNSDHNQPGRRCNSGETTNSDSRYRTPMQWDDSKNGGFSEADSPWLPIGDKYREVNVKVQEGKSGSHLEIYKSLQKFRHTHKAIKQGTLDGFKMVELSENCFAFKRELPIEDGESVLVMINYGSRDEEVKIQEKLEKLSDTIEVKIVGGNSNFAVGQKLNIKEALNLPAFESIVAVYNAGIAITISKLLIAFAVVIKFISQ